MFTKVCPGRSVGWCRLLESNLRLSKFLKMNISLNPAISLLGIYPKKILGKEPFTMNKDVHYKAFILMKHWKQHKCPMIDLLNKL